MDQDAYRKTYQQMNERFCLFEKCLFAGHAGCSQSERFNLAEREGIHCKSDSAQAQCAELLNLLHQHSRFILKFSDEHDILSHTQALRLQVGGIRGLDKIIENREEATHFVADIHSLLGKAIDSYTNLTELPFSELIQQIAAFKGRKG
ncbi:hypothetical protein [Sedimenticola selenatireducens]|jgi:hypothetical protein|uniref:Uncharacterized protein n=1 Tax=Sedimenticola selenatireducens TaxID=191960 RepID=A0A557SDK3_9GAMM|nr:hypothetical protein [Sedimenticola selenatireducens]TVO75489.1 hypothetical protein FHP88_08325 [Sedimenticola selenatireducens]TVT65395.1 MAG: hypothetical protein FHK78_04110 [Sedimenticola selenatireducens]